MSAPTSLWHLPGLALGTCWEIFKTSGGQFVQFANVYGVNTPTMTFVNLPRDATELEIGKR